MLYPTSMVDRLRHASLQADLFEVMLTEANISMVRIFRSLRSHAGMYTRECPIIVVDRILIS